jgi:hypothetical protein
VAAIVVARKVKRFLADWPRANGVGYAVERKAYGGRDRVIGNSTALRRRLAGGEVNSSGVDVDEADRGQVGVRLRLGNRRRGIIQTKLFQRFPMRRARADEEKGKFPVRDTFAQGRGRTRHDLRTNTGRITRRHRYPWTSHLPAFILASTLAHDLEHEKSKSVIIFHRVPISALL